MKYDQPTRHSLILRLRDVQNQAAWQEFVEIYEPLIARIASKLGMQKADAVDATQEVLMHLTKVVDQWSPENEQGRTSFRGWLYRVARNVMIRWMQGHDLHAIGTGNDQVHSMIHEIPQRGEGDVIDLEFQQQVFARVAEKLKPQFQEQTWSAFWNTVVMRKSVASVSKELGMSAGAIYVARSRVMNRIRAEARRVCSEQWNTNKGLEEYARVGMGDNNFNESRLDK